MEHGVNKLLVDPVRIAGVEKGIIDIGGAVVEGREQEAQLRRRHHLSGGAAVEFVLPGEIAQLHFAVFHRAHAA